MKTAIGSVILGIASAIAPVQAYEKLPTETARVESFSHSPDSGTSLLQSRIHGQVEGLCNFSRVEIQSVTYNVTAKHCMVGFPDSGYDIVAIKNFTEFYKDLRIKSKNPLVDVEYRTLSGIPKTTNISRYSPKDIVGKNLSVVGCFPDTTKSRMVCYKITGKPYIDSFGLAVLPISIADQNRILSHDSTGRKTRITGMSGAPVFDEHGDLFGVVSMNTNQGDATQLQIGVSLIMIEPIRTGDGNLITKLVPKLKSQ